MQDNNIHLPGTRQAGFGLIELMIAIVLGLLITAAVTAMAVNSLKMSSDTLKSARLNQDLGAVMQIMVNDIRRAGYGTPEFHEYLKDNLTVKGDIVLVDLDANSTNGAECIQYRYDMNDSKDTKDDNDNHTEQRGFRIKEGSIQMAIVDADTTDCSSDEWENLTDPDVISIESLSITADNSKCYSADMSIRIEPGTNDAVFACNKDNTTNVQKWTVDGDGDWSWVDLADATGLPLSSATPPIIGLRHVNISLEAELANDSSVSKKLDVSVRIRNDYVVPKS